MHFIRTPKGLLLVVFVILLVAAAAGSVGDWKAIAQAVAAAVAPAAALDLVILRARKGKWELPSGAMLTGLIVAMVLTPHEPLVVIAVTATIGVATKYVFRAGGANVFNPAALALVVTAPIFHTGQSWWGALPGLPPVAIALLAATGIFITDRVNKIPMVLAFLGVYFACFTATAFVGRSVDVAEIFRAPDLQAALYFAFFILTDPPTSPVRHRDQLVCGAVAALSSWVLFESAGVEWYLLGGVLTANLFETARRWQTRRARAIERARLPLRLAADRRE
jgi:Na+-translocating ferredoxin:NAD+ oxidoreductase RnfD subunit